MVVTKTDFQAALWIFEENLLNVDSALLSFQSSIAFSVHGMKAKFTVTLTVHVGQP